MANANLVKKMSGEVVEGYKKIEDKFVDAFLTKEGESIEEAKARLKAEQGQLKIKRDC